MFCDVPWVRHVRLFLPVLRAALPAAACHTAARLRPQGYSYDLVDLSGETAAWALTSWVAAEAIDVIVVSAGRGKKRNPLGSLSSNTTDYIASRAPCATLVIHPKARASHLYTR